VVRIRAKTLRKIHNRVRGLADVTIIDLESFLKHLAEQSTPIPIIAGKKKVEVQKAQRVYHLNVIIAFQDEASRQLGRFRLVVDRRGIKRIEPVNSTD